MNRVRNSSIKTNWQTSEVLVTRCDFSSFLTYRISGLLTFLSGIYIPSPHEASCKIEVKTEYGAFGVHCKKSLKWIQHRQTARVLNVEVKYVQSIFAVSYSGVMVGPPCISVQPLPCYCHYVYLDILYFYLGRKSQDWWVLMYSTDFFPSTLSKHPHSLIYEPNDESDCHTSAPIKEN